METEHSTFIILIMKNNGWVLRKESLKDSVDVINPREHMADGWNIVLDLWSFLVD